MYMSGNLLQSGEVSSDSFYYFTWGEMLGKDIHTPIYLWTKGFSKIKFFTVYVIYALLTYSFTNA